MNALGRIFGAVERGRHRDKNDSTLSVTENFQVEKAAHLVSQVPNFVVLLLGRKGSGKGIDRLKPSRLKCKVPAYLPNNHTSAGDTHDSWDRGSAHVCATPAGA